SAFSWSFRVARKVRRDTAIARQPVSVSSVAVELARQVWSGFEGRRVLVVGAGKMSDLATRALRASGATVAVTNRTAARAEALVHEELARCLAARRGNAVGPTITALRSRSLGIARAEAEKTLASLQGLDDRSRRALLAMAEAIVNKLLHAPQVALKKSGSSEDGESLVAAAHLLFDLPAVEALAEPPEGEGEGAEQPGRKTGPT